MGRRTVILPVVLFILLLVGLLAAMFAFRVNSDLATFRASALRRQTTQAAEAGVEAAKALLIYDPINMDFWYNNPDELHRIIVWSSDGDDSVWGTNTEEIEEGAKVYRFSLVADDMTDDEDFVRFGVTDESSKLNLNSASAAQLLTLVNAAVGDREEFDSVGLVNAILDWRDPDSRPRSREVDTEAEFYRSLDEPYRIKNGHFDTVEELLLVRGMTRDILYGEDFDRNGLITDNEDDGDESFPPDNQDGILNRGMYPFLTVLSYEDNVSNDRRQRIFLGGNNAKVREQLELEFEDAPEVVDHVMQQIGARGVAKMDGSGGVQPGSQQNSNGNENGNDNGSNENSNSQDGGNGNSNADNESDSDGLDPQQIPPGSIENGDGGDGDKSGPRQQRRESGDRGERRASGRSSGGDESGSQGGNQPSGNGQESNDASGGTQPIRSPADFLRPSVAGDLVTPSPIDPGMLPRLMDRTTLFPQAQQRRGGLININTAPPLVLRTLPGLTEELVERIVAVRAGLSGEEKETPAWLITEEVVDFDTFNVLYPLITARGQQFTVEALGYADHIGMVTRLQVVLDMVGPIPQTIYYRDISYLGGRYPIREEDLERVRVR